MNAFRDSIERMFEAIGRLIYTFRYPTLVIMLVAVVAMGSGMRKLTVDTSTEGFLHENDPTLIDYNEFRDQFGRDELIVVALKPDDVFDLEFLSLLKDIHNEIESGVPYLDDVTSMINARNTRGEENRLVVGDLLEDWPETEEDLAQLRQTVMSNPLYINTLISENADFTTIVIKTNAFAAEEEVDVLEGFGDMAGENLAEGEKLDREPLTDKQNSEVVTKVRKIIASHGDAGVPTYIAGSPVITDSIKRSMMRDMRKFMVLALAAIALILVALFRRPSGVIFPVIVVAASLVSTLGIMGHTGAAIKLPTQILPSFLLAVGVGDAVHILVIFYRRFNKTGDKAGAISYALGHSGLAVMMTSLTTAGGLMSFAAAEIAPISDLGIYASIGVVLAFVFTVTLLPALIAIFPVKSAKDGVEKSINLPLDNFLSSIGDFSTRRNVAVLVVTALITMVAAFGVTKVRFSHDPLTWLHQDRPVREATEVIDRNMNGSVALEVVVDTRRENGLYNRDTLVTIDRLQDELEAVDRGGLFVGKTLSVVDILKETNKALHANDQKYYRVPTDSALIPQEFLLFENSGSDDLEDNVDSTFSKGRITVKMPWLDSVILGSFIPEVEQKFTTAFEGEDIGITITGVGALLGRTITAVIHTMTQSYIIAFAVISIMMILMIGSLRTGLLSMIPNILPVFLTLGIMGYAGLPLDVFTLLVGSIAIGLSVDDTIHFFHNFRRYYLQSGSVPSAVHETLHSTGRALLVTTVVLSTGFFVFMFASMSNLFNFGVLTGLTIIFALIADFLVAPALLATVYGTKGGSK